MTIEECKTVEAMLNRGGSFVQCLARAYQAGDPDNKRKIRETWPEYWAKYSAAVKRERFEHFEDDAQTIIEQARVVHYEGEPIYIVAFDGFQFESFDTRALKEKIMEYMIEEKNNAEKETL